jgi:hypothetical protein
MEIMSISRKRGFAMTLVAALGVSGCSAAFAHVDVGVSIGVCGVA